MAIPEPIDLPDARFAQITLRARSATSSSRSPFTYAEQVYVWPGQIWLADVTLPRLHTMARAAPWRAFLRKVNGRQRRFLMGDPVYAAPRGSALGAPVLDGAQAARAQTVQTRGWQASESGLLLPGDLIQLGSGLDSRLHEVLEPVDSDASGGATLEIWPGLRQAYGDGTGLTLSNPKGIWRMLGNEQGAQVGPPNVHRISFTAVEAL